VLLAPCRQRLDRGSARLGPGLLRNARVHERQLAEAATRLSRCAPAARLAKLRGRLDAIRLQRLADAALLAARQRLQSRAERLTGARGALIRAERLRIASARQATADLLDRARRALGTQIAARRSRLGSRAELLVSLGYKAVLARGYVLVRGEDGRAVVAAAQVGPGQLLRLDFADGIVRAVTEGERIRKRRSTEEPQPTLFDA
jgi:exodeoxyribonuclease VII large subunit